MSHRAMSNMNKNGVELKTGMVVGIGSPLLDEITIVDNNLLKKWKIDEVKSVTAKDEHLELIEFIKNKYEITLLAGGSICNTLRILQWVLGNATISVTTIIGVIGDDRMGKDIEFRLTEDGVTCRLKKQRGMKTSNCVVLLTENGMNRTMISFPGAADAIDKDHVLENWESVQSATLYYSTGYTILRSMDSVYEVAKHSSEFPEKTFAFNLSAVNVISNNMDLLLKLYPLIDVVFCNIDEALTFASKKGFPNKKDRHKIAVYMADMEKMIKENPRTVIIIDKYFLIVVAVQGQKKSLKFNKSPLPKSHIVDVNGLGDAFVAGYLSQLLLKKPINVCVQYGVYASKEVMQVKGCAVPMKGPDIKHVFKKIDKKDPKRHAEKRASTMTLPFEPHLD